MARTQKCPINHGTLTVLNKQHTHTPTAEREREGKRERERERESWHYASAASAPQTSFIESHFLCPHVASIYRVTFPRSSDLRYRVTSPNQLSLSYTHTAPPSPDASPRPPSASRRSFGAMISSTSAATCTSQQGMRFQKMAPASTLACKPTYLYTN